MYFCLACCITKVNIPFHPPVYVILDLFPVQTDHVFHKFYSDLQILSLMDYFFVIQRETAHSPFHVLY